mmetsp:Transcript_13534/g.29719  ORF Transcript_13534/g.29719 Transcript_13534/m.29719 type:complete len:287 (-) Transcript_13534:354-1214(-)
MLISTNDGITLGSALGKGATACVYRAERHGQLLAVKYINDPTCKQRRAFRRELTILQSIRHRHIVHSLGFCQSAKLLTIFAELCEGGCVFELVHTAQKKLLLSQKCTMLASLASAVEYLHGLPCKVVHRDLKSLNLLLEKPICSDEDTPCVKLCDFGSARLLDSPRINSKRTTKTQNVGTCLWMAPEVATKHYDEKVDVYSFAIVMFELLSCAIPFAGHMIRDIRPAVSRGVRPDLDAVDFGTPAELTNLMVRCWAHLPTDRPAFHDICKKLSRTTLYTSRTVMSL